MIGSYTYTFIHNEDRIQQRCKQTDRQTLHLIPQHLSNAHDIKKEKSRSTCPKMPILSVDWRNINCWLTCVNY